MTIVNSIRAGFEERLSTTIGILPIAERNTVFDSVAGQSYLKTEFVVTSVKPAVRGLNPQKKYSGYYSILICTPQNTGSGPGLAQADLLMDRFQATTDLIYNTGIETLYIPIEYSEPGPGYLDAPFYCTPFTIGWYLYHL